MLSATPVFAAAGKSAPKATGGYDYNVAGVNRHADFNAIQSGVDCTSSWSVTGSNTIVLTGTYIGLVYIADFSMNGTNLTGTVTDPYYSSTPMALTGTVLSDTISFSYIYLDGGFRGTRTFTGTIDSNGLVTGGTWSETGTEGINGTWTNGTAFVKVGNECNGKGTFNYSDETGLYYTLNVKYVSVVGNQAWFAGEWVSGNWGGSGTWLFIRVTDNGEPGIGVDQSAGDVVATEAIAKSLVASHATPSLSGIIITGGNIQVH